MGADKWLPPVVAGVGVLLAAGVAIYVNGPWRKRIVDEMAMRNFAIDPAVRSALDDLIAKDLRRYAHRRRERYSLIRAVFAAGLTIAIANVVYGSVTDDQMSWPSIVGGGLMGPALAEWNRRRRRSIRSNAVTEPPPPGPPRQAPKTRRW